jgi:hypothetical protein
MLNLAIRRLSDTSAAAASLPHARAVLRAYVYG